MQIGGCVMPLLKQNVLIISSTCLEKESLVCVLLQRYPRTQRGTHQNLEEHYDELIAGHEVAVQHAKVKPAPQAAEHLDQHFLVVP